MSNGILIVNKPAGWTSQDVVAKLRGVFHEKRVGHGGTLDPMATGVLPIFIGRATRAVPFFEHADKEYEAVLRLGLVTDTQDITGRILAEHPTAVTEADLEAVLPRFRGEILQVPPMYSAIKVNGRKLYALARQGKEIERAPRPVTVFELKATANRQQALGDGETESHARLGEDKPESPAAATCVPPSAPEYQLSVHCSKGTYIRTLCHDIGQALGCGGCMAALTRTRAGAYTLAQSHTMAEILAAEDPERLLLPTDSLFADRPSVTVNEAGERKLRNGAGLKALALSDGEYRVYGPDGAFLALCAVTRGELKTVKSFFLTKT